jgi:hypothetical protein
MSAEGLKAFFDVGTIILLFLTFAFGAGALITGNRINRREEGRLRQFDSDLTLAKIELGKQKERAEKLESGNITLRGQVATIETQAANAKRKQAEAEMILEQVRKRQEPRSVRSDIILSTERWATRKSINGIPRWPPGNKAVCTQFVAFFEYGGMGYSRAKVSSFRIGQGCHARRHNLLVEIWHK